MLKRRFVSRGHLIDAGIISRIFNLILEEDGDYEVIQFLIGKTHDETSSLELDILCNNQDQLTLIVQKLVQYGVYEKQTGESLFEPSEKNGCAPKGFYSTTNHRTEVFLNGTWHQVVGQRMDACLVLKGESFFCTKLRDIKAGDQVLCGSDSVRVFPPFTEHVGDHDHFSFMSNDVSSERSVDTAVGLIADDLIRMKKNGEKVVVVAGPVVVHTGGALALANLVREGYLSGLLGGNAIAVHDMEAQLYGTSLGVDIKTGKPTNGGHNHHMRAINTINTCGSIKEAVSSGVLKAGLMYEVVKSGIPYCLAGSIRDDGPLPETVTDMIEAQGQYAEIIKDASMVLMLSTMLHSIGTGNMLPSWVKTVCIDINPAVVTKLSDRGSSQTIGIVSDVGLFLRALSHKLIGS